MPNVSPPLTTHLRVLNRQPRLLIVQQYIPHSDTWASRGNLGTSERLEFWRPSGEHWRLVDPRTNEVVARTVTGRAQTQDLFATYDTFRGPGGDYVGGTNFVQIPEARRLFPTQCHHNV